MDSTGAAYVAGGTDSPNFPVTGAAVQRARRGFPDLFLAKINPAGSALVYSTFLGGSRENYALRARSRRIRQCLCQRGNYIG